MRMLRWKAGRVSVGFCSQCGTPAAGRFCAQCGAEVGGDAAGAVETAAGRLPENLAAALCYAAGLVTGIVFLAVAPYNRSPVIRFHAWQSILAHSLLLVVFTVVLPLLPGSVATEFGSLVGFCGFLVWLLLVWKAYNHQRLVLPVIGQFAEKQA